MHEPDGLLRRDLTGTQVQPEGHARRGIAWTLVTAHFALLAFAVLLLAGAAGKALAKPLWHDEIFTLYLATRIPVGDLWSALRDGVDLNPPLYYLAARGAANLAGADAFAVRAPSLVGFLISAVAVYAFVRRRLGTPAAVAAAVTPSLTGASMYAYEGRPYGAMLAFAALAVLAWQSRVEPRWRTPAPWLCALALAAGTLTHYYSVLVVLPLATGELARSVVGRRLDWPMLMSLSGAAIPLVPLRPLLGAARDFSSGFWSRPELEVLLEFFQQLLLPISLLAIPVLATVAGVEYWVTRINAPKPAASRHGTLRPEETALVFALLALPIAGYLVGFFFTGAFHGRYVLPAVLGVAIAVGWIMGRAVPPGYARLAAAGVLGAAFCLQQMPGLVGLVRPIGDPLIVERDALDAAVLDLPIVATPALVYAPLAHYLEPAAARRITYLSKPPEVSSRASTTSDRALRALGQRAQLNVQDYGTFVSQHREFYLYGRSTWLAPLLVSTGAELRLVGTYGDRTLYHVTRGAKAHNR